MKRNILMLAIRNQKFNRFMLFEGTNALNQLIYGSTNILLHWIYGIMLAN